MFAVWDYSSTGFLDEKTLTQNFIEYLEKVAKAQKDGYWKPTDIMNTEDDMYKLTDDRKPAEVTAKAGDKPTTGTADAESKDPKPAEGATGEQNNNM